MKLTPDSDKGRNLLIGQDPQSGKPLYYHGERGLVTIAPPGSGKTQCHIIPNLLTYPGPAIVLDVTGDLWRETSAQRSRFGPVYKIDTDDPGQSDHYNPFDYVRSDKQFVWRDAQTLAALLYSRQPSADSGSGGFFNLATPQLIAAMACFIALNEPVYWRNCETLLRYVSGVALKGFLAESLKMDIIGLQSTAALLKQADKDTLGNVLWTAKNCLIPWEEPQTASISRVSDWHPSAIRPYNATLYICQSLERLVTAPGFVRLILGQHLREFLRTPVDRDEPWIQLFIDEAPQLRGMDVLTQAIEAGRNYNVRVWMAMQWKGQIVSAYGKDTAEGMISACGMRAYMNPALDDGTADDLSKQIGTETYGKDQKERPFRTAQQLAGEEFEKDVIVFDHGNYERVRKRAWFDDPALKRLQGASP